MTTKNQSVSSYEQRAIYFAAKHGVRLSAGTPVYGIMWNDNQYRWVFPLTLHRGNMQYSFKFGQSIAAGKKEPTIYDVLASVTKIDPGTFEGFCEEFGYEQFNDHYTGSNKASLKTYKGVKKEYAAIERLFGDVMEELQEIN